MTVKVSIGIEPFGSVDDYYNIYDIYISNIKLVEDRGFGHKYCNYEYLVTKDIMGKSEVETEGTVFNHNRRDGIIELLRKVCSDIEEKDIRKKIKKLKEVLDTKGISDSGKEYKVYGFTSSHVGNNSLQEALEDLFEEIR